jgi:phosphatidylserine/phosphatidylglycerophosphate/cardiolipin synthase-like enzyme
VPSFPVHRREPRWARALRGGHPWLLSAAQRGNSASGLPAWTEGNVVQALVDGRSYLAALADELAGAGRGDVVLLATWRAEPAELLADDGPPVSAALVGAAVRGATVRLLLWRSHSAALGFTLGQHRDLARAVRAAGGEVVLDQRVRPLGCHHQKFVVVARAADQVAFVGGIDPALTRRDGPAHHGDRQVQPLNDAYGPTPAWHDAQLRLAGPVVHDVATVFRQRWADPAPPTRWPWQRLADRLRGAAGPVGPLPPPPDRPAPAGTCAVQLLQTYPRRRPAYPFAPDGERSVARGYSKALARARGLVYVEDQYLWSPDVARIFAAALRRSPSLRLVAVVPRFIDGEGRLAGPASLLGRNSAWRAVLAAGGERVQLFDLENEAGCPVYVHAKVSIVDDVWAAVGSANLCRRAWTHDSELSAAVLDERRDDREPLDPGGLGDGARTFARQLRLDLMREHLGRAEGDDADLLQPDAAADALRRAADRLDAWHAGGRRGPRPPGGLRNHPRRRGPEWLRRLIAPVYDLAYDPDGRSWPMRARREF